VLAPATPRRSRAWSARTRRPGRGLCGGVRGLQPMTAAATTAPPLATSLADRCRSRSPRAARCSLGPRSPSPDAPPRPRLCPAWESRCHPALTPHRPGGLRPPSWRPAGRSGPPHPTACWSGTRASAARWCRGWRERWEHRAGRAARSAAPSSTTPGPPPPPGAGSAPGSFPNTRSVPAARPDWQVRPWVSSFVTGGDHLGAGHNNAVVRSRGGTNAPANGA